MISGIGENEMKSDHHKNHQLIMDVCQSVGLPSDGWTFWIPAYYKKNSGELDVPETWKRSRTNTEKEYRAYIRPNNDIRIKEVMSREFLVEQILELEGD